MEDDARRVILRRRAQFLSAAAMATVAGCASSSPEAASRSAVVVSEPPASEIADETSDPSNAHPPPRSPPVDAGVPEVESPTSDADCADAGVTPPCRKVVVMSSCLTYILMAVVFGAKSVKPTGESWDVIDATAETLKNLKDVRLRIVGHTDDTEPKKLGQLRADAVKKELIQRGIDESRLTTSNAGKSKPRDGGRSAAARARNRRVEFIVEDRP